MIAEAKCGYARRTTYLALGNKDSNVLVLAGREGKVRDTLNAQLVPHGAEVVALVELDLVGDDARAETLILSVLQVPAIGRLLHKLANGLLLSIISDLLDGAPDLEVLGRIAILILGGALPGAQVGAVGGEAEIVDLGDGQRSQDMADGRVDDDDALVSGVGKVAAASRVDTAPEIPFGLGESRKGFVDRVGIKDADGLLGSVGELQRTGHD